MNHKFPLDSNDHVLQKTSLSFDASVWEFYAPLLAGAVLVMARPGGHQDPAYMVRTVQEQKISVLQLVPAQLRLILQQKDVEMCSSLRRVHCGGEALTQDLVDEFYKLLPSAKLFNLYGPTEVTIDATCGECSEQRQGVTASIGQPISNIEAYVLDSEMNRVPIGIRGELYLGGAGVARGYLDQAGLTADRFVPNPFSRTVGQRLYRTGDQVMWDEAGLLQFAGRLDQQVKLRGHRIELEEIETVLRQHQDVQQTVVVVRGDKSGDERLVAYVVDMPGESELSPAGLRAYLQEHLPEYMIPAAYVPLKMLPLMPNGKVDRKALPEPDWQGREQEAGFRSAEEEIVSGIFADVLKIKYAGGDQNFFELGGHSLLATKVVSRLRQVFATEISLQSLFDAPTVAGMVEKLRLSREDGLANRPPVTRTERKNGLPLSYAQQRLWFIDQLEPNSTAYNLPFAVRLSGDLNKAAVRDSVGQIMRRHEVLRTVFAVRDGQPVQMSGPEDLFFEETDLTGWEGPQREEQAHRIARDEINRPFDLGTGPLFRVRLLQTGEREFILLVVLHHIVGDGWSMGVLAREFSQLYEAHITGCTVALPELPIQYVDFAVWQRSWLQGDVLDQHVNYWKKQLAGVPVLELPIDHARPVVLSHKAGVVPFRLSRETTTKLKEISRREGVTLFMLLLAAFDVALSLYSGQDDVAVGAPIANRNCIEIEGLIGFFVNTLVLRTDLSGNPTVSELVGRVRHTTLEAYRYQDMPFEKLVEELAPERNLSRSPLFQVMLAWQQNTEQSEFRLPDLQVFGFPLEHDVVKFELVLSLGESTGGVKGSLSYARELFDPETIERISGRLERVVERIVENPSGRVRELWGLSEVERAEIRSWQGEKREYERGVMLPEILRRVAEEQGEAEAVECEGKRISYGELNARANQVARRLRERE